MISVNSDESFSHNHIITVDKITAVIYNVNAIAAIVAASGIDVINQIAHCAHLRRLE
jgi:hypothetical protein